MAPASGAAVTPGICMQGDGNELQRLQRDNAMKDARIAALDKEQSVEVIRKKNNGELRWKKRNMGADETENQEAIFNVMKEHVYPYYKYLPNGTLQLSWDPRSLNVIIMNKMILSDGKDNDSYWCGVAAHMAFYHHGTLHTRNASKMGREYGAVLDQGLNFITPGEVEELVEMSTGPSGLDEFVGRILDNADLRMKIVKFLHVLTICNYDKPVITELLSLRDDKGELLGSILDHTTASDDAFAALSYVDCVNQWTENYENRHDKNHRSDDKKQKWKKAKRGRFQHQLSKEAMGFYDQALKLFKAMRTNAFVKGALMTDCKEYWSDNVARARVKKTGKKKKTKQDYFTSPDPVPILGNVLESVQEKGKQGAGDSGDEESASEELEGEMSDG
mmetsp:Transcript_20919/g.35977  ORF Transcript_20919/g.35977 Transcript_20919/m.35977 type:complete len:390 (+) Transcript_20919:2747-3916(+)